MQNEDIKWFLDNYNDLYKIYKRKYIVIKEKKVLGAYKTVRDAYNNTIKTEEDGTFVVQEVFNKKPPKLVQAHIGDIDLK